MTFAEEAGRLAGMAGAMLGWSPDRFWRATPAELRGIVTAMTGGDGGSEPPSSATLARLREMYPDG
ncbi:phage tail assembly chaperone [Sphingomonas pseudosanguinis]|uniref:Putative phage protein (TIGR02216 family) n=1 Tax=Sphingomonas pseudosanguinis TaxID=413712 RepID=A0A7W6A7B8_9SPHN|nr:phage tail assembly chaperone [Sphingomonas pseudosanguinis]MBB3877942.1 putative phage protein (TIGR02216 family) [Sphingomonas pseudosanguinis]MBN3537814.1 phage tail assembly chaperone [Sphingomonas pseudosanguinis]